MTWSLSRVALSDASAASALSTALPNSIAFDVPLAASRTSIMSAIALMASTWDSASASAAARRRASSAPGPAAASTASLAASPPCSVASSASSRLTLLDSLWHPMSPTQCDSRRRSLAASSRASRSAPALAPVAASRAAKASAASRRAALASSLASSAASSAKDARTPPVARSRRYDSIASSLAVSRSDLIFRHARPASRDAARSSSSAARQARVSPRSRAIFRCCTAAAAARRHVAASASAAAASAPATMSVPPSFASFDDDRDAATRNASIALRSAAASAAAPSAPSRCASSSARRIASASAGSLGGMTATSSNDAACTARICRRSASLCVRSLASSASSRTTFRSPRCSARMRRYVSPDARSDSEFGGAIPSENSKRFAPSRLEPVLVGALTGDGAATARGDANGGGLELDPDGGGRSDSNPPGLEKEKVPLA